MEDSIIQKMHSLFNPATVAVVGGSNNSDKLGYHVMKSVTESGYAGNILPVNPGSHEVWNIPALSSLTEYSGSVDLAIIVLPSKAVFDIFEQCQEKNVKGIVLITAGFKEIDDSSGAKMQDELAEFANKAQIPVIGPNTFGMINFYHPLNASFTPEFSQLRQGNVSLVSQSGGISHLLAFLALQQNLGLSKIVGLGNRLNVDFAEMVKYLMDDKDTEIISLYIEGMDQPRDLMDVAQEKKDNKPVVAYKSGTTDISNQASLSHTGSMAGRQEIYWGAFLQSGIFPVYSTQDLLDVSKALSICSLPKGPKVAVLSGQAGPGISACDVCYQEGLHIATFSQKTQQRINNVLPPLALRDNPVDMGPAWYSSESVQEIVRAVIDDPNVDGVIILMMFASANRHTVPDLSSLLVELNQTKPLISCFVAPPAIWDQTLNNLESKKVLINFPTPERAGKALASLWQYKKMMGR